MPSLREHIAAQKAIIAVAQQQAMLAKRELAALEEQRKHCHHTFSPPVKGYEHEGGYCTECGINEVYAECQKIGARWE